MPFKSKAQVRKFEVLLREGKISKENYDKWHAETKNIKRLPERIKKKKKKGFVEGFKKVALNMSEQAALESGVPMQDHVPGGYARENMETGQRRKVMTRTFNVRNEGKEFGKQFKVRYDTSRSKAR
jgi:hypothetical protein